MCGCAIWVLTIEGSWLEDRLAELHRELDARGLTFRPHYWLSAEWFSPDGVPGVAIPFYLAHPRLMRLERAQMLEVEGGTPEWCLQILRHEAGHAFDNAYDLRRLRRRRQMFGSPAMPYPEFYLPRPYSKSFVLHLDSWYAQSHPDEDFAETFAVWLTPGCRLAAAVRGLARAAEAGIHGRPDERASPASRRLVRTRRTQGATRSPAHDPAQALRDGSARTTAWTTRTSTTATCDGSSPPIPEYQKNPKASRVIQSDAARRAAARGGVDRLVPVHDRPRDRGHGHARQRDEPAPEVPARPHEARLHDARDRADDEPSAFGAAQAGAVVRKRSRRTEDSGANGARLMGPRESARRAARGLASATRSQLSSTSCEVDWIGGHWCAGGRGGVAVAARPRRLGRELSRRCPRLTELIAVARTSRGGGSRRSPTRSARASRVPRTRAGDRLGRREMKKDGLENVRKELGDGAEVGARPREPRPHRTGPPAAADARARQRGRHAGLPESKATSSSSRTSMSSTATRLATSRGASSCSMPYSRLTAPRWCTGATDLRARRRSAPPRS